MNDHDDEPLDQTMLLELQRRTRELPREIDPPADAWNRIAAEIGNESRSRATIAIWQKPAFLAAAALLLIAATSLVTARVVGGRTDATRPIAIAPSVRSNEAQTSLAEFTARENDYIATVNVLSATLERKETGLSPETIAKLKESISVIDNAILEARRALAQDPSNKALVEMLASSYDQKVDLLKRTAEMASL
ncbi:MAG TPA: hypothetical protein VF042_04230 [Gemmatimonadaceae bacterium]